jgi:hypothetical protein
MVRVHLTSFTVDDIIYSLFLLKKNFFLFFFLFFKINISINFIYIYIYIYISSLFYVI